MPVRNQKPLRAEHIFMEAPARQLKPVLVVGNGLDRGFFRCQSGKFDGPPELQAKPRGLFAGAAMALGKV